MNFSKKFHDTAMYNFLLGRKLLAEGSKKDASTYFLLAFEMEKKAALSIEVNPYTRWVLLRSAANMANYAQKFSEAEKLIEIALSENPPAELVEELNAVRDFGQQMKQEHESDINIDGIFTHANTFENEIKISENGNDHLVFVKSKIVDIVRKYLAKPVKIQARKTANGLIILEKISLAA